MTNTTICFSTTPMALSARSSRLIPSTPGSQAGRWRQLFQRVVDSVADHSGFTPSPTDRALRRLHEARSVNR